MKRLLNITPAVFDSDHWGPYREDVAHGPCECGATVALLEDENECPGCFTLYDRDGDAIGEQP